MHQNIDENVLSSKYRTISANFVEIRRNSLSLLLHSTVEFEENFSIEYQQFSDNELQICCKNIKPGSKAKCEMIFTSIKRGILTVLTFNYELPCQYLKAFPCHPTVSRTPTKACPCQGTVSTIQSFFVSGR